MSQKSLPDKEEEWPILADAQMAGTRREVVKTDIGMIAVGVSSIVLTRDLDCFEKVLAQNEKGKSDINLKSGKATYW